MNDGIQWLISEDPGAAWSGGVVFARGIDAQELARRLGAPPGPGTAPMTDAEIPDLDLEAYRPGRSGDGVVRVGEHAGWAFAMEYGHCEGLSRIEEVSRDGAEAVYYADTLDHPPTIVFYARDGRRICGFGLMEEQVRWGTEPDLLLPDLVAAGILTPEGTAPQEEEGDNFDDRERRALAVFEKRFGLSLPRTAFTVDRLLVYAVNGVPDPDFEAIRAWAGTNGHPVPDERLGLIPAALRRSYVRATDPHWQERLGYSSLAPAQGFYIRGPHGGGSGSSVRP